MISDKERRAVAQKLRNAVELHKDNLNDNQRYSLSSAFDVFLSMFDGYPSYSDLLHLADLIDRPTCTMTYKPEWSGDEIYPTSAYQCSNCGCVVNEGITEYCPDCGCRVSNFETEPER